MYLLKWFRTALFNSLIYFFFREKMSALCAQTPKRLTLLDECYDYYFSHRLTRHMIRITKNIARWWRKPSALGTSNHGVVKVLFFFFSFLLWYLLCLPFINRYKIITLFNVKRISTLIIYCYRITVTANCFSLSFSYCTSALFP